MEIKFIEWQRREGERKTVLEFADYLGSSQQTVSSWMNGSRKPTGDSIRLLAEKFGLEVYDILKIPRPDAGLFYLQKIWGQLPPEERRAILEKAERYVAENENQPQRKRRNSHS